VRSLEKREQEHLADLERSRRAYATQQLVLNSMQEGLFARDMDGNDLIVNAAAQRTMDGLLDHPDVSPAQAAHGYGIFLPGTGTPYPLEQLPMYRALRGESGSDLDMLVRNSQVPEGRLIRCRYRPMREGRAIVGGMVTFLDITQYKQEQDELLLLRNAVAMLNDIVMITEAEPIDEPGPRIVFVNEAFERLTGYSSAEVVGLTPRILQGPDTDRAALDRMRDAMQRWQPVRQEVLNYTKAGRPFWNEIDIVPLADATGWYTHWISVERDITGRKLAQQALEESERRYQVLFDQSPLPMWVFDVQSLAFLEVNESAIRRYGFSRGEFLSMTLKGIRAESEWARVEEEVRRGFPGGTGPWWHMCKDGSKFPVQIASQGIAYDGHEARFTVVEDISVRHQAQQVVLEQQFALQRAADAAALIVQHHGVHDMLDEVARQARGVIRAHQSVVSLTLDSSWAQAISAVSLSDKYASFQRLEGEPDGTGIYALVCETNRPMRLTQAELVAHPRWRGFGAGADRHPPMRGWLAVPLIGRDGGNIGVLQLTDKYEGEFTQHDEYIAVEMAQLASVALENARLFETINLFNADLEKKVAERTAELTRQEAMFRALAEQAPQVVWTYEHGRGVTFFNRAWYELMGGSPPDWHGHDWVQAIHPDDLEEVTTNWKRAERAQGAFGGVRRLHVRDGRVHTMSYRAVPVLDQQGQVSFWVGIDADITELKAFEQALRRSNEELEAFSYSVAHDLRAPLNSIDGFSQLLVRDLGETASSASLHYVARIQAGVAQMAQLIEDLLQLAQLSRTQMRQEPIDLGAMAREILDRLRAREPRRQATITVHEDLRVQGDSRLVRVLMENLLANAWKFSSQLAGPAQITVGGLPPAHGERVVYVRDNGAGFDMAYANKLFQVFQRLHGAAEFPGTGVGLAIARRVMDRHGGRIWAESSPGQGATFYFVLPDTPPVALPMGEAPHG
jgi:PAS domain S-box-containing protein